MFSVIFFYSTQDNLTVCCVIIICVLYSDGSINRPETLGSHSLRWRSAEAVTICPLSGEYDMSRNTLVPCCSQMKKEAFIFDTKTQ